MDIFSDINATLSLYKPTLDFILVLANISLVIVTAIYVKYTRKILNEANTQAGLTKAAVDAANRQADISSKNLEAYNKQISLMSIPVIGISIMEMSISEAMKDTGRRQLSVNLNLVNIGNGPAIEIYTDAEIIYEYVDINGEKCLPAYDEPSFIPFLRVGDEVPNAHYKEYRYSPRFERVAIDKLFDDLRESGRMNMERIRTNLPTGVFPGPKLKVTVYYKNNLDQYFESIYETEVWVTKKDVPFSGINSKNLPAENETGILRSLGSPNFQARTITKNKMDEIILSRNKLRKLNVTRIVSPTLKNNGPTSK